MYRLILSFYDFDSFTIYTYLEDDLNELMIKGALSATSN